MSMVMSSSGDRRQRRQKRHDSRGPVLTKFAPCPQIENAADLRYTRVATKTRVRQTAPAIEHGRRQGLPWLRIGARLRRRTRSATASRKVHGAGSPDRMESASNAHNKSF